MRVRAIEKCYDGLTVREEGEEFEYLGPPHASLMPVGEEPAEEAPQPKRRGRPPNSSSTASASE